MCSSTFPCMKKQESILFFFALARASFTAWGNSSIPTTRKPDCPSHKLIAPIPQKASRIRPVVFFVHFSMVSNNRIVCSGWTWKKEVNERLNFNFPNCSFSSPCPHKTRVSFPRITLVFWELIFCTTPQIFRLLHVALAVRSVRNSSGKSPGVVTNPINNWFECDEWRITSSRNSPRCFLSS